MALLGHWSADKDRRIVLWSVAAATFAVLGFPLSFLIIVSFRGPADYLPMEQGARWTIENFKHIYLDPELYSKVLPDTLVFATGSVAISVVTALALAWHFERSGSRERMIGRTLVMAPLALPTPAIGIAWIQLLGPNVGWINQAVRFVTGSSAESGPFDIYTMSGLIWCQGIAGVPVAYLLLAPAIRSIQRSTEEAGYAAGARPWAVFRCISMAAMLPGLAGPVLVLFVIAFELVDFPYILGPTAGVNVLGTRMLWEMAGPTGLPNVGGTAAISTIVLVVAALGIITHDRLVGCRRIDNLSYLGGHSNAGWRSRSNTIAMRSAFFAYVIVSFLLPICVLLSQASEGIGLRIDDSILRAARNTLFVAVTSAILATTFGAAIAMCAASGQDRVSAWLDRLSLSSVGIPSLLVAFGMGVVFLSIPIGLYGTIWLLAVAYSYRIALATRMAKAGLTQIGASLQEAAQVSGARWIRTQVTVLLPMIVPNILAAAMFLFVVGIKEFTIPLMLYSPNNVVLSVLLVQLQRSGSTAEAATIGLAMTVLTLTGVGGMLLADRWLARTRGEA